MGSRTCRDIRAQVAVRGLVDPLQARSRRMRLQEVVQASASRTIGRPLDTLDRPMWTPFGVSEEQYRKLESEDLSRKDLGAPQSYVAALGGTFRASAVFGDSALAYKADVGATT